MIARPSRAELTVAAAGVVLLGLSLLPWWRDVTASPSTVLPWRASTVWSGCLVVVAAVAIAQALVRRLPARVGIAAVGTAAAIWTVAYTVDLWFVDLGPHGWWTFSGDAALGNDGVVYGCGAGCRPAIVRDDLAVVSGVSRPTGVGFAGLALVVLIVAAAAVLTWRAWRRQRRTADG